MNFQKKNNLEYLNMSAKSYAWLSVQHDFINNYYIFYLFDLMLYNFRRWYLIFRNCKIDFEIESSGRLCLPENNEMLCFAFFFLTFAETSIRCYVALEKFLVFVFPSVSVWRDNHRHNLLGPRGVNCP